MDSSRATSLTPKAEATRQRILDTALRLFPTNGYERTSMRDVAAAPCPVRVVGQWRGPPAYEPCGHLYTS